MALLTMPSDYVVGTISLTNGSVDFTGTATAWLLIGLGEGDLLIDVAGATQFWAIIDEITSNTAGKLTRPWAGPDLVNVEYRMRFTSDGVRSTAQAAMLRQDLGNGNIQALAGLDGSSAHIPMFTGPGAMTLVPKTDLVSGAAYDVQVADIAARAAYDGQAEGFSVLVADTGDGRAAIYTKNTIASEDWSAPAYVTGPVGPLPAIEAGTTTTLAPGSAATFDVELVTGGYALNVGIPEGEGFDWAGVYNIANAYIQDDVVRHNGSAFIAIQAVPAGNSPSSAFPPVDTAFWEVLAAKGLDGTGTGDVVGPSSAADERIAVFDGTTGKLLKVGPRLLPTFSRSITAARIGDTRAIEGAIRKGAAKVVFWGDSIMEGISQIDYANSTAGLIRDHIVRNIGGVTWSFENYSIAGTNATQAANGAFNGFHLGGDALLPPVPDLWPNGDTPTKAWRDWVKDSAPDMLFLAFGMNAEVAPDDHATAIKAIIAYVRTFPKVPTIVLVTPILSTRTLPSAASPPEHVQNSADVARGVAAELNVCLADANALYRLHLDGVDILRKRMRVQDAFVNYASWTTVYGARATLAASTLTFAATGRVDMPDACQDFEVSVRFGLTDGNVSDVVYRGSSTDPDDTYLIRVESLTAGTAVRWYNKYSVLHLETIPYASTYDIIVQVSGAKHRVWVNGGEISLPNRGYHYERIAGGKIGLAVAVGSGTATRFTARLGYAPAVNETRYTEADLLGVFDWGTNDMSIGGSGVNHPSTICTLIDYFASALPVLDALQEIAGKCPPVLFDAHWAGGTAPNKIVTMTEMVDRGGDFDAAGGRFVAPVGGYYKFDFNYLASASGAAVQLYINGAANFRGASAPASTHASGSFIVEMAAGDFAELFVTGGGVEVDSRWNHFSGSLLA